MNGKSMPDLVLPKATRSSTAQSVLTGTKPVESTCHISKLGVWLCPDLSLPLSSP